MNIEQFHQMEEAQRVKNFHKLIKANGSAKDLNKKVLAYAKNTKYPLKIYLTKAQKNNPGFLLTLYTLQPELTNARYPGESLYNNVDFMFEYYKIRYNAKLLHDNIYLMTHFNPEILTNVKFVEKIAREFPNENILKVIKYAQVYAKKYTFASIEDYKFTNVIMNLPLEVLSLQSFNFGSQFVEYLPKSHPNYVFLVKCASTQDKNALRYLPKSEIYKENKDKGKSK